MNIKTVVIMIFTFALTYFCTTAIVDRFNDRIDMKIEAAIKEFSDGQ